MTRTPPAPAGTTPIARTLSPTLARRLAITRQQLAGPRPSPDAAGLLAVTREIGCLQLDPTSKVARSHLLVLWSRVGGYDPAQLDHLLWTERRLFEYWAHAASIVLTEDYPIHSYWMRQRAGVDSKWSRWARDWMEANHALRDHILGELAARGPLRASQFEDRAVVPWPSSGWNNGRNVGRMLDFLWSGGQVMVAGRQGGQRLWDLTERHLPADTPREELDAAEVTRRAVLRSLGGLGVARVEHIKAHYTRGGYPDLKRTMERLLASGEILPVAIRGDAGEWPGPWYVRAADLPLLDDLTNGGWSPRVTLLSPFDNLICDRDRTELLFDFRFRLEIYTPKHAREYGYFVLPILDGDRLIGRVDPAMDRKARRLTINAVHAEPDAPLTREAGAAVGAAIRDLGAFLGAREIVYTERAPEAWRPALD
jgi:uncharacterized protein